MPELESLIEEFMAFWWRVHPTAATIAGVHLHDAALEAYDPDSITERRGRLEGYLELFDRAAPPGQTREVEVERSEEHTSELQSRGHLVRRLLLAKQKKGDGSFRC